MWSTAVDMTGVRQDPDFPPIQVQAPYRRVPALPALGPDLAVKARDRTICRAWCAVKTPKV